MVHALKVLSQDIKGVNLAPKTKKMSYVFEAEGSWHPLSAENPFRKDRLIKAEKKLGTKHCLQSR